MAEENGPGERTEEATPQRREQLKNDGRSAISRDLGSALVLMCVTLVLYMTGKNALNGMGEIFESSLVEMGRIGRSDIGIEKVLEIAKYLFKALIVILAPVALGALVIGVAASLMQTGFMWSTKPLEFDLEKLNPLNGLTRIFSSQGLFDLAKSCLKFVVVGAVVYWAGFKSLLNSEVLLQMENQQILHFLGANVFRLMFSMALAFCVLAVLDYGFQKFQFEQKLKMTKQEVKDDRKEQEGNPQIKARIRGIQRQMATRKMMDAVKKADVVVTNPTHIAVALVYDRENMLAPKVVAKGADFMAEQIKKIAREAGVPCVENVPLARAMFKAYKIGQFISRDVYNAVAEVLAYVYRLKGKNL